MTALLLGINSAVFIIQNILESRSHQWASFFHEYLALSQQGLARLYWWQPLTFQFLHGGFLHLLFNMLCLYFFGRFLEDRIGRMSFLKLYLISGVAGGLLQTLLGFLSHSYFGAPVVGASAGVFGLIAAFSLLEPNAIIHIWFVLPIRSLYFLYIAGAVSLFFIFVPSSTNVAHAAHLGGLLAGVAFMQWSSLRRVFSSSARPRPARFHPRELLRVRTIKNARWPNPNPPEPPEMSPTEFISREVDPILDKISAYGIQSLTPKERQILEAARSKMRKR